MPLRVSFLAGPVEELEVSAPLSHADLGRLIALMREAFSYLAELKGRDPLAEYIQYPKITPFLSESLALQLLAQGELLPGLEEIRLGARDEADIVASTSAGQQLAIEVKGTGSGAWVFLSDKDYACDFLIWIFFDDYFKDADRETIDVFIARPHDIPERPQRITLRRLTQILGDRIERRRVNLDEFLAPG